jgi:calcineurin-like phosphoesterase family protein
MIIKLIKEYFRKEPKVFFTSDTHFYHARVIDYCNRPFKDVYKMNEHMIKVWNKTVKPFDIVYHLGDFSMGKKAHKEVVPRLNGTKILISGNHCPTHVSHKNHLKIQQKYIDYGWAEIYPHTKELILKNGLKVLMSHLPYAKEGFDQRYLNFRPEDKGQVLLHGHLHGRYIKDGNQIDLGWDAHNGKILNEDELIAIINDKRINIKSHLTDFFNEERSKVSEESAD